MMVTLNQSETRDEEIFSNSCASIIPSEVQIFNKKATPSLHLNLLLKIAVIILHEGVMLTPWNSMDIYKMDSHTKLA